jgi:hypothetical protein
MSQLPLLFAMALIGLAAPPSANPESPLLIFALAVLGVAPRLLKH